VSAMFAIMKALSWDALSVGGFPLQCPPEGPHKFIPVFDTWEQASEWIADQDLRIVVVRPVTDTHD